MLPEQLNKLIKLLGINFKFPEKLSDSIKFQLKIGSDNKITKIENNYTIYISTYDQKAKELLRECIINQVEQNIPLLDNLGLKDVEETSKGVDLESNDKELLGYFKGKLPSRLYELFELCLILRNMRLNHLDIRGFKLRIMKEYPIYGRNMTNLVNEKYFEYKFKELYIEMEQEEDFDISKFHEEIDYQIRKLPSMVFIDSRSDYDILLGDARWKLMQMIEHGLEDITVHAIGYNNVDTAKNILKDLSKEDSRFKDLIDGALLVSKRTYFKAVIRK